MGETVSWSMTLPKRPVFFLSSPRHMHPCFRVLMPGVVASFSGLEALHPV